jgi:quaternary ammonium compound-resistance protein SugE
LEEAAMAWLLVVAAGLLETGFAVCLKLSHGLSRLVPTVLFAIFAVASFGLLTLALKHLDVGRPTPPGPASAPPAPCSSA